MDRMLAAPDIQLEAQCSVLIWFVFPLRTPRVVQGGHQEARDAADVFPVLEFDALREDPTKTNLVVPSTIWSSRFLQPPYQVSSSSLWGKEPKAEGFFATILKLTTERLLRQLSLSSMSAIF